jgi:hypothetical protein
MQRLLRGGRVIDPGTGFDGVADLLVSDGRISAVGPGFVDLHSHVHSIAGQRLQAMDGVPTYTHVRELTEVDPATPVDGSEEIAIVAAETGAAMHHCHVNSTSGHHIDRVLGMLERSRRSGSRVTVEAYPYGAGSKAHRPRVVGWAGGVRVGPRRWVPGDARHAPA